MNDHHSARWAGIQILIHWLTLVFILGLAMVGLLMTELPAGQTKIQVYNLHKSFGLTVLALTALRLLIRLWLRSPPPLPSIPRLQRLAADAVHGLLYLLLFAIPLSGWIYNSASGFPLKWFGLFSLPKLGGYNPQIKEWAGNAHEYLFYALAALVTAHALAALFHHYRQKDATLRRMAPWWRDASSPSPSDQGRA